MKKQMFTKTLITTLLLTWVLLPIGKIMAAPTVPYFDPIPVQIGTVGSPLSFTVTAHDPSGGILSYSLDPNYTIPGMTIDAATGLISWPGEFTMVGSSPFNVLALDSLGSTVATVQVTVAITTGTGVTIAPIPTQTVIVNQPWNYTIVGHDPAGSVLWYGAIGDVPATLTNIDMLTGAVDWTPDTVGSYTFAMAIFSSDGNSDLLAATPVTINVITPPPVISPIATVNSMVNKPISIQVVATGGTGALTYSLSSAPAGATIDPATGLISWTPSAAGTFNFDAVVTDSVGSSASTPATVIVSSNNPPVITVVSPQSIMVNNLLSFVVVATDPDGDPITYSLGANAPVGATINATSGLFQWTPGIAGPYNFDVAASDGIVTVTSSVTVTVNGPPAINPVPAQTVAHNSALSFTVAATDPNGLPVTFSLGINAPVGATIDPATGVFSWTPATPGSFTFDVAAANTFASSTASVTVTVTNDLPVIATIPAKTVYAGKLLSFTVSATDANGDPITYSLGANAPTGATINSSTGAFSWTPDVALTGMVSFDVLASDPYITVPQTVGVNVLPFDGTPPTIAPTAIKGLVMNGTGDIIYISFSEPVIAVDGVWSANEFTSIQNGTTTLDLSNAQFNYSSTTLTITLNPATAVLTTGNMLTVTPALNAVTDLAGNVLAITPVVSTNAIQLEVAPVIAAIPTQIVEPGTAVAFTTLATDANGDPITYSLNGAPAGAVINSATGAFSWMAGTVGTYTFSVQASDNFGFSSTALVTIIVDNFPKITTIPTQIGNVGNPVSFTVVATDADGNLLAYSLGANAPTGSAINATSGAFSWTPTAIGNYSFDVLVSDGIKTVSTSASILVSVPPTITPIPDQKVKVNQLMSFTVSATSAIGNALTYALGANAPAGAAIDATSGVFSWTPVATGTFSAEIDVTEVGTNLMSTTSVKIIVATAPQFPPVPEQEATETEDLKFTESATDDAGLTLTYSLDKDAPIGITINSSTGELHWPSVVPGNYVFHVIADNGIVTSSATATLKIHPMVTTTHAAGTYHQSVDVDLGTADTSTLKVSTDGTDPSCATGTTYSTPIHVTAGAKIKVRACYGTYSGPVKEFDYNVDWHMTGGNFQALLNDNIFEHDATSTVSSTQHLTVTHQVEMDAADTNGTSTVIFPTSTVISRDDGSPFDATKLISESEPEGSLTGFIDSHTVVDGALHMGLNGLGLVFNPAVQLSIAVGNSHNGQTLQIMRSVDGASNWTVVGLSPNTCMVTNGMCNFSATKASHYAVFHIAASSGGSSGGGGGGGGYTPTAPTVGAMPVTLGNGGIISSDHAITLNFNATNVAYVAISEDQNFTGANWDAYSATKSFALSSGNGMKKIYVKFRSTGGGVTSAYTLTVNLTTINGGTTTSEGSGVAPQQVLGVQEYANGTLLRGPDKKVYLVVNGNIKPVSNLKVLGTYGKGKIYTVSQTVINAYPNFYAESYPDFGDGNLVRDTETQQVYLIGNGMRQVLSDSALKKYKGRVIIDATSAELAYYLPTKTVTIGKKPYGNNVLLKGKTSGRVYLVKGGSKLFLESDQLAKYSKRKTYTVSEDVLERYPLTLK